LIQVNAGGGRRAQRFPHSLLLWEANMSGVEITGVVLIVLLLALWAWRYYAQ
jgi:hypothetical protein